VLDDPRLITQDDFQINTKRREFCHRCSRVGLDRIGKNAEPDQRQIRLVFSGQTALTYRQDFDGDCEEPITFAIIVLLQRLDPLTSAFIERTSEAVYLNGYGARQNCFGSALRDKARFVIPRGRNGQTAATEVEGELILVCPRGCIDSLACLQNGLSSSGLRTPD
jgi:hypothetical protein